MECRRFLCLLFLAVLVLANNAGAVCPDGYVEKDGTCYFFSEVKKDLQGATVDCTSIGGTLATFEDCETESEVVSEHETEEPCTYWVNPLTECVDSYSPKTEYFKYICAMHPAKRRSCEDDCGGDCLVKTNGGCPGGAWIEWKECPCDAGKLCCVAWTLALPQCEVECRGRCSSSLGQDGCPTAEGFRLVSQMDCTCKSRPDDDCCKPIKDRVCEDDCKGVCKPVNQCDLNVETPTPWYTCPCPKGETCCVPDNNP